LQDRGLGRFLGPCADIESPRRIRLVPRRLPRYCCKLSRHWGLSLPLLGTQIWLLALIPGHSSHQPSPCVSGQQRIKLDHGIVLLDTPGVLWPKLENRHGGYRLAITGAIKETAVNNDDIAMYAVGYFRKVYPELLKQRYHLDHLPEDDIILLELIGAKRGCLGRGGIVDLDRAAKIVLTEFRDITIGRISLETPDMMEGELLEMAEIRAKKEAQQAAKKKKRHGSRS